MNDDDMPFMNIVTRQVFPDEIFTSLIEWRHYEDFIVERLKPDSNVSIFAPLKKSANKKQHIKVHKVVDLKENWNHFAKYALMQGKLEIGIEVVVGSHELNAVPLSLFNDDGSMLHGGVGKADVVTEVLVKCGVQKNITLPVKLIVL